MIRTQPILLTFVRQIMWALPWSSCRNGMAVSSILEELLLADDYQGGIWSNDLCKLKLIDSVNNWYLGLLYSKIFIYVIFWYNGWYLLALISSVFANVVAMEKLSIEQLNTNDGKYELWNFAKYVWVDVISLVYFNTILFLNFVTLCLYQNLPEITNKLWEYWRHSWVKSRRSQKLLWALELDWLS